MYRNIKQTNNKVNNNCIYKEMELLEAIRQADIDAINQLLLNPRVNVNATDDFGTTPLIEAAAAGLVDIGQRLINMGADINHANIGGYTPLIAATMNNRKDFVILLLEQPAINLDALTTPAEGSRTALTVAIRNVYDRKVDAIDIVELLLNSGADPDHANFYGNTALYTAIILNQLDVVKLLVEHGADVNSKNNAGVSIIHRVTLYQDILDYLLTVPGLDIDATDSKGRTALMISAESRLFGEKPTASLLAAGADPLIVSKLGKTAHDYAQNAEAAGMLKQGEAIWISAELKARQDLQQKFMIARRLRQGINTTEGVRLELPQKQLPDYIIRRSEYDNLCMGLQNNLNKPGVIALAHSLRIPTSNQTKIQLCNEIAKRLII